MNAWILLRLGFESIRGSSLLFKLFVIAPPVLIFFVLLLFFPPAALVWLGLWLIVAILILALVAAQMKKLINIKISPYMFRSAVNRDKISRLADELTGLGFTHVGYFKVEDRSLFFEGLAKEDLKIYAMIASGDDTTDAYVEFSSSYADGGRYCVSGSKTRSVLPRPANMVNIHYPGQSVEKLFGIFLRDRPEAGLLDAPADKFQETVEQELRRTAEYIFR